MKTVRVAMLPVEVLWEYREFKRDEVPAPRIPLVHDHDTEQVTEFAAAHGIEPLELSIIRDRALLTDGNHRIVAARRLGYEHVAVNVTVYFGSVSETFYQHTIERFKPITKPLAEELKKLFLGNDWNIPLI